MKLLQRHAFKSFLFLLAISFVAFPSYFLYAAPLPEGGVCVSGTCQTDINGNVMNMVRSNGSVENWTGGYNIAQGYGVNYHYTTDGGRSLDRDISGRMSFLNGSITADNGTPFIINNNGIIMGQNFHADVNGLVASTLDIKNEDFRNGHYNFFQKGRNAFIDNQGSIVAHGGYVSLLSNAINNAKGAYIEAPLGNVILASGKKITVPLDDFNDISVAMDEGVETQVFGADHKPIDTGIKNEGSIKAENVILTEKSLNNVFKQAINNAGIIEATHLVNEGGVVKLLADDGLLKASAGSLTQGKDVTYLSQGDTLIEAGAVIKGDDSVELSAKNGFGLHSQDIFTKKLIIDPLDITIATGGTDQTAGDNPAGTPDESLNDDTDSSLTIDPGALANLSADEIFLQASRDIFLNNDLVVNTDIRWEAGRDIILSAMLSTTKDVYLQTTTGSILNGPTNGFIKGDHLTIRSDHDFGGFHHEILTSINHLDAVISDTGVIYLQDDKALTIDNAQTFAGHINIYSAGPMNAKKLKILTDSGDWDIRLQASGGLIVGDIYSGHVNEGKLQTFSGSIEDDGDPNTWETADAMLIDAAEGVGLHGPLEVNIDVLLASSHTGDINIINHAHNDFVASYIQTQHGNISFNQDGNFYAETMSTDGHINIDAGGSIAGHASAPIVVATAHAPGAITLSNDVANGTITATTADGPINLTTYGPMTINAVSLTDSANNNIILTGHDKDSVAGTITAGNIDAGTLGNVGITSDNSSIIDDGDASTLIKGNQISLFAQTGLFDLQTAVNHISAGIGQSGNVRLQNVNDRDLDVDAYVPTGDIYISQKGGGNMNINSANIQMGNVTFIVDDGNLNVTQINAGMGGAVNLTANQGSITAVGTGTHLSARNAILSALNGTIGLNNPFKVNISQALKLIIGQQVAGDSGKIAGTVANTGKPTIQAGPAGEKPPGKVYFNGNVIWPDSRGGGGGNLQAQLLAILQQLMAQLLAHHGGR